MDFENFASSYLSNLKNSFNKKIILQIESLANDLKSCWENGNYVFICGNGGSAGNAMHIANDFHYGVGCNNRSTSSKTNVKPGIKMLALPSNPSILTCLANDIGYDNVYAHQLKVLGNPGDLLIVLSGSGNSQNVIKAIAEAKRLNIKSIAILGFDGGKCKKIANESINFEINDMQIAEDTQLILFHLCMQWISKFESKEI